MIMLVPLVPATTRDPLKIKIHPVVKQVQDSRGLGPNAAALLTLMLRTEEKHPNSYVNLNYANVKPPLDILHDQFARLRDSLQRRGYLVPRLAGEPSSGFYTAIPD